MTQAEIFEAFMRATWNDATDYDKFADACEVATCMGAKGTNINHPSPNTDDPDSLVREYLFSDGSHSYVIVTGQGIGVGASEHLP